MGDWPNTTDLDHVVMCGARTHVQIACLHETGHALAALSCGYPVGWAMVSRDQPGAGQVCRGRSGAPNPYDPDRGDSHAQLSWEHTCRRIGNELFILLAGPLAEAKALNKPLRHLGCQSDLKRCERLLGSMCHLHDHMKLYLALTDLDIRQYMREKRLQTRRWVGEPGNWKDIESIASELYVQGVLDAENLNDVIGQVRGDKSLQSLFSPLASAINS